jgi:hypothetical protein
MKSLNNKSFTAILSGPLWAGGASRKATCLGLDIVGEGNCLALEPGRPKGVGRPGTGLSSTLCFPPSFCCHIC